MAEKRRIPQCVQRLAKLSSLAGLPSIHVEDDGLLQDMTKLLSEYGASPDFAAPNADSTGYYLLYNKRIFFVQLQKKWELGSIEAVPEQHIVPIVTYLEQVENIVSFVTSSIDDDFVFLVHKKGIVSENARSLLDMETRWLRFQTSEHVEEFIGHCLSMGAPQLLSKARMLMFQTGGAGSNLTSLSVHEIAAETERLVAESERTLVVTDLVVKHVSDLLTKVREEVIHAMKKSADFSAKWGNKYNKIQGLNLGLSQENASNRNSAGFAAEDAPHGIKTNEYDFQHVGSNEKICARIEKAGEKKILFSSEAHLSDRTHEIAILTDKSLRIEKQRKDREVHVIPYHAIEEIVHEGGGGASAGENKDTAAKVDFSNASAPKVLIKIDFSICKSIRGDIILRFPPGPSGLRMKNLFLLSMTSIYEAVVVSHLPITESTDVFWACRGGLESQLVRMTRALRPDEDNPRTQNFSATTATPKMVRGARLGLYLCLKQPHRVIASLSASSDGVEKRLLSFLARTMHRIFVAHQEAVAQEYNVHSNNNEQTDEYKNHGDLRCIPLVQPCVDYEISSYKFHRSRLSETRERSMSLSGGRNFSDEYYSKSTADDTLLVPPSFGSSDCFASLALKQYIGTGGSSFVSLCLGRPMEDFSSNPQTLQSIMSLQTKQHWASTFLRHIRNVVLGDGVDEVLPGSFKVVVALIWQHFERDRHRNENAFFHTNFDEVTVIGGLLFNQFFRPALDDPLGEGLITEELSEDQKKNLKDVSTLIECVLNQSDLPLAGRLKFFSDGERRFLRRFIDNEVQDANRMLKSLIYPEVAQDDPEDDGSAVPDFFPPPVPGELSFGSVELLPYGDPRTVESFWTKYVLKMPIDLHNMKLLNAFAAGLKSVSLQMLTAAFTPQLHDNFEHQVQQSMGMLQQTTVVGGTSPNRQMMASAAEDYDDDNNGNAESGDQEGGNNNNTTTMSGIRSAKISLLTRKSSSANFDPTPSSTARNGGDDDDNISAPSTPASPLGTSGRSQRHRGTSFQITPRNSTDNNGPSSSFNPPSTTSAAARRMRSSTLIRAENTAQERSAMAERTIHRLTLEVKNLKEQLAQAKQAELETRMAAARTIEQFSHSLTMQMAKSQNEALRAQKKAMGTKKLESHYESRNKKKNKKKSGASQKKKRVTDFSSDADSASSSSSDNSSSSSSSDASSNEDLFSENPSELQASFSKNNTNPFDAITNASNKGVNMSSVLSPEARWRQSLEHLPAASRSTRGAGSESVFGCPMDAQALAFLALPIANPYFQGGGGNQTSAAGAAAGMSQMSSGRNSPWNQPQPQTNPLHLASGFDNFSFVNKF